MNILLVLDQDYNMMTKVFMLKQHILQIKQLHRYFTSDTVTLDGIQEKISKDLQLPLIENHNLGIIPVNFMQNLPKKNFFCGVIGDYYPDNTAYKRLQKVLNHTLK